MSSYTARKSLGRGCALISAQRRHIAAGGFGVSINDGSLFTNDTRVTMSAWAPNVTHMRLSNDGGYSDENWSPYQITNTWVISTYGTYVMPRYVYVWFRDVQLAVYGPYQDDIIYDPIAPQGSLHVMDSSPPGLQNSASVVTLSLEASDDNSGVAQMRLAENDVENAPWQPVVSSITWTLQSDLVYAQFQDRAGNLSPLYGSDGSEHALDSRPLSVTLSGPTLGLTNTAYTFTADVLPVTATLPITYIWQATSYSPITHTASPHASDVLSFTWDVTGTKFITVTAINGLGVSTGTYTITVIGSTPTCPRPLIDLSIQPVGSISEALYVDTLYTFQGDSLPADATPPITYTWAPTPYNGQGTSVALYQWNLPGTYTITLAAQNCGDILLRDQLVVTVHDQQYRSYLPLISWE